MNVSQLGRCMSILVAVGGAMAVVGAAVSCAQERTAKPKFDAGLERNASGAIFRGDQAERRVAILVRCDAGAPAVETVLTALAERGLKASFFLASADLREPVAGALIKRLRDAGHYVGPEVDGSLSETLTRLREQGVAASGSSAFGLVAGAAAAGDALAAVSRELGVELVLPSAGVDAETLARDAAQFAGENLGSLNGVLLLVDLVGADSKETFDPARVGDLADQLIRGGYDAVRVDQLCATAMRPVPRDPRYPPHWWTPEPMAGAPAWEILPQAAGPGEVILSKRHELGLLSNFAATPFTFHGKRYASLEGFWQMMKFPERPDDPRAAFAGNTWPMSRDDVAGMTAFEAKAAGDVGSKNMRRMGIDWVSFEGRRFPYRPAAPGEHYDLIVAATQAKVAQNPDVQRTLLATGDLVLKPDHRQEANAPAAWRYFEILTAIREKLQAE